MPTTITMTFFNTVFREILTDPFMMAPMTSSMTPMMGPTQQMARMVRMMDSMMVSDMSHVPMQMPVRRNTTCPVHSAAKTQTRTVASTQTKKNIDKPVSWTVKMNSDKPQATVPRENRDRNPSTSEGTWKNSLRQREKLLPAIPNPSARIDARMEERRKRSMSESARQRDTKLTRARSSVATKIFEYLGEVLFREFISNRAG